MSKTAKIVFLLWFICMFLLAALFGSKRTEMNLESIQVNVSSQDELYFKNIRSFYYTISNGKAKNIELYNLTHINPEHPLNPTICNAWGSNQALILFENLSPFIVQIKTEETTLIFTSENMNGQDQLRLAYFLYKAINEKREISLNHEQKTIALKANDVKKINTVLIDYFKLIGELR